MGLGILNIQLPIKWSDSTASFEERFELLIEFLTELQGILRFLFLFKQSLPVVFCHKHSFYGVAIILLIFMYETVLFTYMTTCLRLCSRSRWSEIHLFSEIFTFICFCWWQRGDFGVLKLTSASQPGIIFLFYFRDIPPSRL